MDLHHVKVTVKAWEKAFKAEHARNPTKDDIKSDPNGIAEQYALYRKLSKEQQSQSQASSSSSRTLPSSTASYREPRPISSIGTGSSLTSTTTPRVTPRSEYPTTPTPPARRSVSRQSTGISLDERIKQVEAERGTLKRTASKAVLNPPSPTASSSKSKLETYLTPKKARPYSGPIHDPNPINPFAMTPPKPSTLTPSRSGLAGVTVYSPGRSTKQATVDIESSPFIHASSPRKFKELLEHNSLRKVKERTNGVSSTFDLEVTPRTRARKRLRGETVADTPMKDKLPRRRRGERRESQENKDSELLSSNGNQGDIRGFLGSWKGKSAMLEEEEEGSDDEDDEDEDAFGPSPMKAPNGQTRAFTELVAEAGPSMSTTRRPGPDFTTAFKIDSQGVRGYHSVQTARRVGTTTDKGKQRADLSEPDEVEWQQPYQPSAITPPGLSSPNLEDFGGPASPEPLPEARYDTEDDGLDEALPPPPPDPILEAANSQPMPSKPRAKPARKVVSLSDDEEDEWDPEGGHIRRELFITRTRRAPVRVQRSDSFGSGASNLDDGPHDEEEGSEGWAEGDRDNIPDLSNGTSSTSQLNPSSPTSNTNHHLAFLSLKSPGTSAQSAKHRLKMDELRVKAIFNPADAKKLKAIRKGQDIHYLGEGVEEGDGDEDQAVMDRFMVEGSRAGLSQTRDEEGEGVDVDGEGDDDWEEDCEGWKRSALGMDDDDGW